MGLQNSSPILSSILLKLTMLCVAFFSITGCDRGETKAKEKTQQSGIEKVIYYCPMHPEIQQDHPGRCPKSECKGMELEIKISDAVLEDVLKSANENVLAAVKTIKPVFTKRDIFVESNGYVDYDPRGNYSISSIISGRIDKLYIKYQNQFIHSGELIFEIYSAELVTAQENYLYLINHDSSEKVMIEAAEKKLKLLGLTDSMLEQITKSGTPMLTIPVYSKYEGNVQATGMDGLQNDFQKNNELDIKEGMYVEQGQTIASLVSTNIKIVLLQIKTNDISKVRIGQRADIITDDNTKIPFAGKIEFIEPVFKDESKTVRVRVAIENKNADLKIGTFVKAKIKTRSVEALWVPESSVVHLGKKSIVWVKKMGNYSSKVVETGIVMDKMIEISDGVTESDSLSFEAHYLSDSESFIRTKNEDE